MHLKKRYTFVLICIFNVMFLHAQEDFSVYVKLKDYNITNISQVIPTDLERDMDKGYYLPITVSLVNNTNKRKHLNIGGGICANLKPWKIRGHLRFTIRKIRCKKTMYSYKIWLKPKEVYTTTHHLFSL